MRCKKPGCGSYAFNLGKDGIDQGEFCDVHYWQHKAEAAIAELTQLRHENTELHKILSIHWPASLYGDGETRDGDF